MHIPHEIILNSFKVGEPFQGKQTIVKRADFTDNILYCRYVSKEPNKREA